MSDLKALLTRSHDLIMRELHRGHTAHGEEKKFESYLASIPETDVNLKKLAYDLKRDIRQAERKVSEQPEGCDPVDPRSQPDQM
jgi:hypothetical protein